MELINKIRSVVSRQSLHPLSIKERRELYRSLKKLLKITPLTQALQEISKLKKQTKKGAHLGRVCDFIIQKIRTNHIMGKSLNGLVPTEECTILIVGEDNGLLSEVLDSLLFLIEIKKGIIGELVKALTYPVIMIVITLFGFVAFKQYGLPIIELIVPSSKWPPVTQLAASIATIIKTLWPLIILATIALVMAIAASLPRWSNSTIRQKLDQYPGYGTYRYIQSATFIITLAILQKSGSSLDASLKVIRDISQPWLKEYINKMIWKLRNEKLASKALDVGLIPSEQIAYIEIATKTGDLDNALNELGKESILEFKDVMTIFSIIANTTMMLILGGSLLLLVFAWYGAILPSE